MSFDISNRRYLGSKSRFIDFIKEVITSNCKNVNVFADIFGGTGNVAWNFNNSKKIIINDLLFSNFLIYNAFFGSEQINKNNIKSLIKKYNNYCTTSANYFSKNFSNTFFSEENCKKIGFIRNDIESLYQKNDINFREKAILITSLMYAMDKIANTVGHYDAFRINGNLNKKLVLEFPNIPPIHTNKGNMIFCDDANKLVKKIKADLVYIDPPYNSRQYCDAYHLLENVARWEKPKVFGIAKKMNRFGIKSKYCLNSAPKEFDELVSNIDSKYILVSYNNMGENGAGRSQAKIKDSDIYNSLSKRGTVLVFEQPCKQFTTGKSSFNSLKERLFLCKVGVEKNNKNFTYKAIKQKFIKSPLNYIGGKYKLLPQLFKLFPNNIDTFIDAFGGGFNVGVNSDARKVIYNDSNEFVSKIMLLFKKYTSYKIIDNIDNIIEKYGLSNTYKNGYSYYRTTSDKGVGKYNKSQYTKLRNDFNSYNKDDDKKWFMLLTLIIFAFNNQIRFSSKGLFNTPVGKRDFNCILRKNIHYFGAKVQKMNVTIRHSDFSDIDLEKNKNIFVYCDPPYLLGLASYNENNAWNENEENKLLSFLLTLNKKGIKFALSNVIEHKGFKNELLEKWIKENKFNVHHINSNYKNSNYQLKMNKFKTKEILVTNY